MKKLFIALLSMVVIIQLQAQQKIKNTFFSADLGYGFATTAQNTPTNALPFLANSQSITIRETFYTSSRSGIGIDLGVGYMIGANDKNEPANYAKKNDIAYSSYSFTKSSPSALLLTTGIVMPLLPNAKKMPIMRLRLNGGVALSNGQAVQYKSTAGQILKEVGASNTNLMFSPQLSIVTNPKAKLQFVINIGYNNVGGVNTGVGIAEANCWGMPCFRCNIACCCTPPPPPDPKPKK